MSIETITISLQEYNALKEQIQILQEEIRLLKNGRNSKTSSTPPSHDISRNYQKSLREPSARRTGGQDGHTGSNLKMKEIPDKIIQYQPNYCKQCGSKLSTYGATLASRKQEIGFPIIVPQYTEHQSYTCTCQKCGFATTPELPGHLTANVQYSPQISAWVSYLSVRQYISYRRIAELMKDCFQIPISEGTIDNMLKNITNKAQNVYQTIAGRVEKSVVVGGDETGIKINTKKGWLFTFQTPALTFLVVSLSRGYETIKGVFKNGFPISVYVTDCLAAQLKTPALLHQICLVHLLRELNNFIDAFNCQWAVQMKQLLQSAIRVKSGLQPHDYLPVRQTGLSNNDEVNIISKELQKLLRVDLSKEHKKVQAFIKRLNKNQDAILPFLYHPKVPPHNNASEGAIRNAKIKMKVSNQFKSFEGAYSYAVLRSIIDTTIKNSQNVLGALMNLASFAPAE